MNEPWQKKIVIGDCTLYLASCEDVLPLLGKVDTIISDPPYGMSFVSNHREVKYDSIKNDNTTDLLKWLTGIEVEHSKYIFCRWDNIYDVPKPKSLITWVKNNWSMGDLNHEHARQTEVALFYAGEAHYFPQGRPTDVIKAPRTGNEYHPTEKPVQLMMEFVKWTSGTIVDPFMGSGSTIIAAARMGRKATGIEIDPTYFEIACKRITDAYKQPDMFVEPPKKAEQLMLE